MPGFGYSPDIYYLCISNRFIAYCKQVTFRPVLEPYSQEMTAMNISETPPNYPTPVNNLLFTLEACESTVSYMDPLEMASGLIRDTGVNLFLTGKAGTGKTTFLRRLSQLTDKRMVILAPTGVAAINAGGSTIHSFFQLSFAPFIPGSGFVSNEHKLIKYNKIKRRIIRSLDLLVIDEVSMVRPDVLDAIDDVLRRFRDISRPFGGVQLLLIGDLRQLAPVAQTEEWELLSKHYSSPYFFESHALKDAGYVTVELTKVFRQQDETFVNILNSVRDNAVTPDTLRLLNRRVTSQNEIDAQAGIIRLTTHNYLAERINESKLEEIDRPVHVYNARIDGTFPEYSYPADKHLNLKVGAQVMFTKNDPSPDKLYYNGLIGTVSALKDNVVYVTTMEETPRELSVTPVSWDNVRYALDDRSGEIVKRVEGSFTQIPLRTAWAITIHKSQGLTFDKAVIDASRSFAPGQTYVALSRCRSLEGLYLEVPLSDRSIMTDGVVSRFISTQARLVPDEMTLRHYADSYYISILHELFDLKRLARSFDVLHRVVVTELATQYPRLVARTDEMKLKLETDIIPVADKFHAVINSFAPYRKSYPETAARLNQKIMGGAKFFNAFITDIIRLIKMIPVNVDNQQVKKRLIASIDECSERAYLLHELWKVFSIEPFDKDSYLKIRARVLLSFENGQEHKRIFQRSTSGKRVFVIEEPQKSESVDTSRKSVHDSDQTSLQLEDIRNPHIYDRLRIWRQNKSIQLNNRPLFMILSNKALLALASAMPENIEQLSRVHGFGKKKITDYGEELIELIWQE